MSIYFEKTIDNQHTIEDLTVERLIIDPFNNPRDIGKNVTIGSNGALKKTLPVSSNVITIKMDANLDSPYEHNTLYGAIDKARTTFGTLAFENPVAIMVQPGVYYETQAIVITATDYYLSITAIPQYTMCQFYLVNELGPNSSWITIQCPLIEWADVYLFGGNNCDIVFDVKGNDLICDINRMYWSTARYCSIRASGTVTVYNVLGVPEAGVLQPYAVVVENGATFFSQYSTIYLTGPSSSLTQYYCDNAYIGILLDTAYGTSDYLGTTNSMFCHLVNNATVEITAGRCIDFDTVFKLESGSTITTRSLSLSGNIQVNNNFDNTCLWTCIGDLINTDNLDLTTLNFNNTTNMYMERSLNNTRGLQCLGRLVVGNRDLPSELYVGQGGSNIKNSSVLQFNPTGSIFTNITNNLKEDNSISTNLFSSLIVGSIFYIGDRSKFASVVLNVTSITGLGTAVIISEYWNGTSWTSFNFMTSQSNSPYTTYANNAFSVSETQVIRLAILLQQGNNWISNSVNGIVKYWIRFRVSSGTLITSPVVNYFKILGNTTIIKQDGSILHHGLARTLKLIPYDMSSAVASGVTTPQSQDLFFSSVLKIGRINNKFRNGDALNGVFLLPADLDSSSRLSLRISFFSDVSTALQTGFGMTLTVANVRAGDLGYISVPTGIVHPNEQVINFTLIPNQTNGMFETIQNIDFSLPSALSGSSTGNISQLIVFNIRRNTGTNNPVFNQFVFAYYSFRGTGINVV